MILKYNQEYGAKATVIVYDNEKYTRYEAELEDDPLTTDYDESILKTVKLAFPSFAPLEANYTLKENSFKGWLRLEVPADTVYQIYYGKRDENPLYLMVTANSGDYREPQIFTYTYKALLDPATIKLTYPQEGKGKLYLDVYWDSSEDGRQLLPETDYYVYLFGDYANLAMIGQDMAYASGFGLLGNCKFTTPK